MSQYEELDLAYCDHLWIAIEEGCQKLRHRLHGPPSPGRMEQLRLINSELYGRVCDLREELQGVGMLNPEH